MSVWRTIRAEPVATMAIVTALSGLAVLLGANEKLCGAIGVLIGAILAFPVRSGVMTTIKAAAAVTDAANQAAETAVRDVGEGTAGAVGEVTSTGLAVAGAAAQTVASTVLAEAGIKEGRHR